MKNIKKAWVIRWEVMPGDQSRIAHPDEVVAILPSAWRQERVLDILERLYKERTSSLSELAIERKANSGPYKTECASYVHGIRAIEHSYSIGHNPVLFANKAHNVRILNEAEIEWEEHAPIHPKWLCEKQGENNCPLKEKPPHITLHRYQQE
jgi:hypothetical protein